MLSHLASPCAHPVSEGAAGVDVAARNAGVYVTKIISTQELDCVCGAGPRAVLGVDSDDLCWPPVYSVRGFEHLTPLAGGQEYRAVILAFEAVYCIDGVFLVELIAILCDGSD